MALDRCDRLLSDPPAFRGVVIFLPAPLRLSTLPFWPGVRRRPSCGRRRAPRGCGRPWSSSWASRLRPSRAAATAAFGIVLAADQLDRRQLRRCRRGDGRAAAGACSRPAGRRTAARSCRTASSRLRGSRCRGDTTRRAVTPCELPAGASRLRLAIEMMPLDERPQFLRLAARSSECARARSGRRPGCGASRCDAP